MILHFTIPGTPVPMQRGQRFSDAEADRLRSEYALYASTGRLSDLAAAMGRNKTFLCVQAAKLGLTDSRRSKAYLAEGVSRRMREWYANNPCPLNMLGRKHTAEARGKMSRFQRELWASRTPDERAGLLAAQQKGRIEKHGSLAPMVTRGTWKAGWRYVGRHRRYFRSKWEANYARYLEWLREQGKIMDWKHEPETFWFEKIKRGVRSYLPDFRVWLNDGTSELHEVKGWMDARSATCLKRMAKYHPQETIVLIEKERYREIARSFPRADFAWED